MDIKYEIETTFVLVALQANVVSSIILRRKNIYMYKTSNQFRKKEKEYYLSVVLNLFLDIMATNLMLLLITLIFMNLIGFFQQCAMIHYQKYDYYVRANRYGIVSSSRGNHLSFANVGSMLNYW